MTWKTLGASVVGTSHEEADEICQDAHAFEVVSGCGRDALLVAVSDGAGSAARSAEGSSLVCQQFLIEVREILATLHTIDDFCEHHLAEAWVSTRATLLDHAATEEDDLSAFACTFLTAVVLEGRTVCGQIGDGAMVLGIGSVSYTHLTLPTIYSV